MYETGMLYYLDCAFSHSSGVCFYGAESLKVFLFQVAAVSPGLSLSGPFFRSRTTVVREKKKCKSSYVGEWARLITHCEQEISG